MKFFVFWFLSIIPPAMADQTIILPDTSRATLYNTFERIKNTPELASDEVVVRSPTHDLLYIRHPNGQIVGWACNAFTKQDDEPYIVHCMSAVVPHVQM